MKTVTLTEHEYECMMQTLEFAMYLAKPVKAVEIQDLRAKIITSTEVAS